MTVLDQTVRPADAVALVERAQPDAAPLRAARDPRARLAEFFDEGTLEEITARDDSGVLAATGRVAGSRMVAFASDPRVQGGAMGTAGCAAIVRAYDTAVARGEPVIGLWHSGGARLAEGVESLHAVGSVFAAMTKASGVVPQISVVLGPAAGGAAYGPALTDVVILSGHGRIFVTGPDVVRSVTGEDVDMARLGGPEPHSRRSGVVHVVTDTDKEAFAKARRVASLLAAQGIPDPAHAGGPDLAALLPDSPRRAYDVHPLVDGLLDEPGLELHAKWAPNLVTSLGRLAGRTVGVIANNPMRLGGCLDATAAEKAARFVRMCDHAFAEAAVPRVTLVTRKAYGGAYIAMNSRALGATRVFAWPNAEVAVMGAVAAVRILHRRKLAEVPEEHRHEAEAQLAEEHEKVAGGLQRACDLGVVDEVIEPNHTRLAIAKALAELPPTRGAHGNIPL